MATKKHQRSVTFLTDFNEQDELVIPADLSTMSDADLTSLKDRAVEAFTSLWGQKDTLSDEDMSTLAVLTDGLTALQTEATKRETAVADRRTKADEMAAQVGITLATETLEPEAEVEVEETETEAKVEEIEAPEALATERRISLAAVKRQAPAVHIKPDEADKKLAMKDIVMAAPDVPGFSSGQGMDWLDMGKAVDRRLGSYSESQYETAARSGRHIRQQFGTAIINKPFDKQFVVDSDDPSVVQEIINRAVDEKRLPGGSLVASGGWCAPSQVIYDVCELESRDGIIDLPEVAVTRGGIKYTTGPDFSAIYNGSGFIFSEQNDIDKTYQVNSTPPVTGVANKPCYKVPCPSFVESRLQVGGVCITAGLLQSRGYPEIIARTIRGALVANDHRIATNVINTMVAGSTAVSLNSPQVGATAPILTAIELQVQHYRSNQRMSQSATLEAVFPMWTKALIRSDLSRRAGANVTDALGVSDAQIQAWFAQRGVAPQWVYNWQGLESQSASARLAYPTTIQFMLYSAGTWIKGTSDIITLDTVYDSTLLGTNDYTALFTEEGWLVAKTCFDSRVITVPICADGAAHQGVGILCDGTAAPATSGL